MLRSQTLTWLSYREINPVFIRIDTILKWKDERMDVSFKDILGYFLV